jgi:peptidoglycan/xylan/chitin deacetylase (PgdA/CDA1 family)
LKNTYKKTIAETISYINFLSKSKKSVLTYHSVNSIKNNLTSEIYQINPVNFSKHLTFLKSESINFKTLSDFTNEKPGILITFDDGYKAILKTIYDLIENKIPVVLFICPKFIKLNSNDYLNLTDIRDLLKSNLVEIGSHSYNHVPLTLCSQNELLNELDNSKKWLEDNLSIEIKSISYPFGKVNDLVEEFTKKVGYDYGFTTKFNSIDEIKNLYRISRVDIWSHDTIWNIKSKIDGKWNWLKYFT